MGYVNFLEGNWNDPPSRKCFGTLGSSIKNDTSNLIGQPGRSAGLGHPSSPLAATAKGCSFFFWGGCCVFSCIFQQNERMWGVLGDFYWGDVFFLSQCFFGLIGSWKKGSFEGCWDVLGWE